MREKGIPEENMLNFIDYGKGIIFFPLTIPFTWRINIRKQMNLFKIFSSTSNTFFTIRYYKKERKEGGKKGWKKENLEMLGNVSYQQLFYFSHFVFPQMTVQRSEKKEKSDFDTFVSKHSPLLMLLLLDEVIISYCLFICVKCLFQQFNCVTKEFFCCIISLLLSHIIANSLVD